MRRIEEWNWIFSNDGDMLSEVRHSFPILFAFNAVLGCAGVQNGSVALDDVNRVLDDWHDAASKADESRYLGHMAKDAVFLGTDATEHWTKEEFLAFVRPYFSKGQGWTYFPRDRHVMFSADGTVAWFDERLDNDKYGELRGTGVLRNENGVWKIVHYSMTFPIPNEVSKDVVEKIRADGKSDTKQ